MSSRQIDDAILNAVGERWTKIAMAINRVVKAMGKDLTTAADEDFEFVFKRIQELVIDGRLAAQGNIENWRSSEVRRAEDNS